MAVFDNSLPQFIFGFVHQQQIFTSVVSFLQLLHKSSWLLVQQLWYSSLGELEFAATGSCSLTFLERVTSWGHESDLWPLYFLPQTHLSPLALTAISIYAGLTSAFKKFSRYFPQSLHVNCVNSLMHHLVRSPKFSPCCEVCGLQYVWRTMGLTAFSTH